MRLIVTGGAGFIGSTLIRQLLAQKEYTVLNLDNLSYAANQSALDEFAPHERYEFSETDIRDKAALYDIFSDFKPNAIMHLAAESHVDRSIDGPDDFIATNVMGTCNLLQAATYYFHKEMPKDKKESFRFHHISTDEVYGSLGPEGLFTEETPYSPNSPYSASKASSDHLVRAWKETYGLPTMITNCSNNYGPYQFPEKLVPLMIIKGLREEELPVYGDGKNIRDWLHVEDHTRALQLVLKQGAIGETYNIGGNEERTNIEIVERLCDTLDQITPPKTVDKRRDLIRFVEDRRGHDRRYAIDSSKIQNELDWQPEETFETGLDKTIKWYVEHEEWWSGIEAGDRLGLADGQKAQKA